MLDHDQLRTFAKNPALIERETDLNIFLEHIDSCRDCSIEVNKSIAFFEAAIEPLSKIGPHLSLQELSIMRAKDFTPKQRPARSRSEWHLTLCTQCRRQFEELPRHWQWGAQSLSFLKYILQPTVLKFAIITVFLGVSAFVYFHKIPQDNPVVYRSYSDLSLTKPEDNAQVEAWQTFTWEQPHGRSVTFIIKSAPDGAVVISHTLKESSYALLPSDVAQLHVNNDYTWYITMTTEHGLLESAKRSFRFGDRKSN